MIEKPKSPAWQPSPTPPSGEPVRQLSGRVDVRDEPAPSPPWEQSKRVDLDSLTLTRVDRWRLTRSRRRLSPEAFQGQLAAAVERARVRLEASMTIAYPDDLPISSHRSAIIELLVRHRVLIVCGETGSGKSTQLPKMCLEAGLGRDGAIGHTQPRRLAARSIADRLAEETRTTLGQQVGYQIRFGDQTTDATLIKLMTDGILLAETASDPDLLAYDVLIIDEAHERSLNIDFLIGYLRRLLERRDDLKVILTSATIDAERFAAHFAGLDVAGPASSNEGPTPAPILQVEGRGYPVEIRNLPWEDVSDSADRSADLAQHVIAAIESLRREGTGDTLVFLPTEREIREVSHRVAGHFKRLGLSGRVECLPLYARLPQSQQQAIFHPSGGRQRLIFATNVAESSLTVPGIRYVIDSGTARISRYSPRSKLQRLPIEPISRASANQRAGRCGRVGPGICVRLYSDEDFRTRADFTTPEIRRTNLASVVLQSKVLRLGSLADFPLLDPPRDESIREGVRTLEELGAIDERQELTPIGWQLGRLPVDPRVGRMLIEADQRGVLAEVLPIAAALEIQDPRDRPPDKKDAADQAHAVFVDPDSDFLSYLRMWRWYDEARAEHSRSKLTRVLQSKFLSPNRMREWSDVVRQLREMVATSLKSSRGSIGRIHYADADALADAADLGSRRDRGKKSAKAAVPPIVDDSRYALIHQSLLAGLLSGVAIAGEQNAYTGAGGLKLFLWPGSGLRDVKPKWIVAADLVETSRQYARTVARIQPAWIEAIGEHVLKSSYSDPHWSKKASGAFCYQRRSLFGLPVVIGRRVPLPPIDPATSRELLIRHGLVAGDLLTTARFVTHNRRLLAAIEQLAAKTRRREWVVDEMTLEAFFQQRLPEDVADRARLEKFDRNCDPPAWASRLVNEVAVAQWLADQPEIATDSSDATTPYLRPEDLLQIDEPAIAPEDFPDEVSVGASRLPLTYQFQPGAEDDGVHLTIHQAALPQVSDEALGWLVPGLLLPKVTAMIKSLPKRLRRNLVPAADVAVKVAREMEPFRGQESFPKVLCSALTRHAGMPITAEDFQADKLDPHWQFLVRVVDDSGGEIARDRGVDSLKASLVGSSTLASTTMPVTAVDDRPWSRRGMTTWDIDAMPIEVVQMRGGIRVAQFPGLVCDGEFVSTSLFADLARAEANSRCGLTRLLTLACRKDLRAQVRHLPRLDDAKLKLSPLVPSVRLESELAELIVRVGLVEGQPIVRDADQWSARVASAPVKIGEATQEIAGWLGQFTDRYHELRKRWESLTGPRVQPLRQDIASQRDWLLADGFLGWTPWPNLQHVPRYLHAIAYRLDKSTGGAETRDSASREMIAALWNRWLASLPSDAKTAEVQAASEFRWLIEELRVSQFAQPLGTACKVSPQRCEKLLSPP